MAESRLQRAVQAGLFASRWLLAPFYVGLAIGLVCLLGVFAVSLGAEVVTLPRTPVEKLPEAGILLSLSLIDLSLTANLLIIVTLAGYENFVQRIDTAQHVTRLSWMGKVDFSGLKIKLVGSIVSIAAISLLRADLELEDHAADASKLLWQVVILLVFVVAGVMMALMDFVVARTDNQH